MLIATGLLVLQTDKFRRQIFLNNKTYTFKVAVKRYPAINECKYTKSTS